MSTTASSSVRWLTLVQAAAYLEIDAHSLRTLLRKGRLEARKSPVPGMPKVIRWEISSAVLDHYMATRRSVGKRLDGRNKFSLYATQDELERIRKACPWLDEGLLHRANPGKTDGDDPEPADLDDIVDAA